MCFYPRTTGYTSAPAVPTPSGFNSTLTLAGGRSNYGNDANTLQLQVWYETQTRAHFKITDPATARWEIPAGLVVQQPPPATAAPVTDYSVTVTQAPEPFGVVVTRKDGTIMFDSRVSSLTGGLIFSNQFLELSSAVPTDASGNMHVFGIGEHIGPYQLQYNASLQGGKGFIFTNWARDQGTPVAGPGGAANLYADQPYYTVLDPASGCVFGVLLLNSNAKDVLLQPGAITYRTTGGVLDVYIFTGPTPRDLAQQYAELIGTPRMPPRWALGFHLCRWDYHNITETMAIWQKMQDAGIPQDAQWNDIDYMSNYLDFTHDETNYPLATYRAFVDSLHASHGQRYVQIIDPGISSVQAPGSYPAWDTGIAMNAFMMDPNTGKPFIGKVWPGLTAFPDWDHPNASAWWTANFNRSRANIPIDGAWIDMNEISNFCEGPCSSSDASGSIGTASNAEDAQARVARAIAARLEPLRARAALFERAEAAGVYPWMRAEWDAWMQAQPEFRSPAPATKASTSSGGRALRAQVREASAKPSLHQGQPYDPRYPPYLPGRMGGETDLWAKTVSTDVTQTGGIQYDWHSLFGFMEGIRTGEAMQALTNERPVVIARSTFISSGRHNGHWLGDNTATWSDMYYSMPGALNMNMFGIPLVGADTGFGGSWLQPELAARWHQLESFVYGFARNHNSIGKPGQAPAEYDEPYRGAMKAAITERYRLLPYWYTEFAHAHETGEPVTRPLWFEFPSDPAVADIDTQVMIGRALLVCPVLAQNATNVTAYVPTGVWYDWFGGAPLSSYSTGTVPGYNTLPASLQSIPVLVRGGSIVPTQSPNVTTAWQAASPFQLTMALPVYSASNTTANTAVGYLFWDDGVEVDSYERGHYVQVDYTAAATAADGSAGSLTGTVAVAGYTPPPTATMSSLRILGVTAWQATGAVVTVNGADAAAGTSYDASKQVLSVAFPAGGVRLTTGLRVSWASGQ